MRRAFFLVLALGALLVHATAAVAVAAPIQKESEEEESIGLGARLLDSTTGVSLRPPLDFVLDGDGKPSEKLEPGTIGPALRAISKKGGQVVVLVLETRDDALVSHVSGDGLEIMKNNFGAERPSTSLDFAVGPYAGTEYHFLDLPKTPKAEALLWVFGVKKTWHFVIAHFPKGTSLRAAMRAAAASFERYDGERLDAILGEPAFAPGTTLGLRAPLGYWKAPAERTPEGAALALVRPYSRGRAGTLAVFAHEGTATALALGDAAAAAMRAADEGIEIGEEARLVLRDREWRVLPFVAGDEGGFALLTVDGGKGIRVEYRVAAEERWAATDATVPMMLAADFASEAARRTRALVGKDRYLATVKSGMPAAAAPFLVELARSGDAKEAVPVLVAALAEKPQPVRLAAVRGLGALAAPQGFAGVKKIAEQPPTKDGAEMAVQLAALRALGEMGDPKANPILVKKLAETHLPSFEVALDALVRIGEPRKSTSDQIIRAWAKAESAAKNPRDAAAKERLAAVGPLLARALEHLTGEAFEGSRAAREWWDSH
jgi:hypothetical protein